MGFLQEVAVKTELNRAQKFTWPRGIGVGINARLGYWNKVGINEEEPGGLCTHDRSLFFIWRATGGH